MTSPLDQALKQFDATEANLQKLERLWGEIKKLIPEGMVFGDDEAYDDKCRSFSQILKALPAIDGWSLPDELLDYNAIGQMRFDASEVGDLECAVSTEETIFQQGKSLREYRFRFNQKRKELVRKALLKLVDEVDEDIWAISQKVANMEIKEIVPEPDWEKLKNHIEQINTLFG